MADKDKNLTRISLTDLIQELVQVRNKLLKCFFQQRDGAVGTRDKPWNSPWCEEWWSQGKKKRAKGVWNRTKEREG